MVKKAFVKKVIKQQKDHNICAMTTQGTKIGSLTLTSSKGIKDIEQQTTFGIQTDRYVSDSGDVRN